MTTEFILQNIWFFSTNEAIDSFESVLINRQLQFAIQFSETVFDPYEL